MLMELGIERLEDINRIHPVWYHNVLESRPENLNFDDDVLFESWRLYAIENDWAWPWFFFFLFFFLSIQKLYIGWWYGMWCLKSRVGFFSFFCVNDLFWKECGIEEIFITPSEKKKKSQCAAIELILPFVFFLPFAYPRILGHLSFCVFYSYHFRYDLIRLESRESWIGFWISSLNLPHSISLSSPIFLNPSSFSSVFSLFQTWSFLSRVSLGREGGEGESW